MIIKITGIQSVSDRLIVYFDIEYNGNSYKWQDYGIGSNMTEVEDYIQSRKPLYEKYITEKEILWSNTPKTRVVQGIMGEQSMTVSVQKEEVVHPPFPDYVEKRKKEYPDMALYLDGLVKDDQEQIAKYIADCLAVKEKYPKDYV